MNESTHILGLCATYNRRDITIAALENFKNQLLPPKAAMDIAIVDDASTDGTLEAIHNLYPDVLTINSGGGLFWAGAMRLGFNHFWNQAKYTHLLVFNDDIVLFKNSIIELIDTAMCFDNQSGVIVVGAMIDGETGLLTYGGLKRKAYRPLVYLDRVKPKGKPQFVDTLNMNLALISRSCLANNEFIRSGFTHSLADFDFGLRASKNKTRVVLAPSILGECSRNQITGTWQDANLTFSQRWTLIFQPKGLPLYPRFKYLKLHARFIWPFILFLPYIRLGISHFILFVKRFY